MMSNIFSGGGRMKATLTDDKGNVVMECYIMSCSISSNSKNPYVRDVELHGIQMVPVQKQDPNDILVRHANGMIGIDTGYGPDDCVQDPGPPPEAKARCNHDWADYKGLVESYRYCKTCGVKQ